MERVDDKYCNNNLDLVKAVCIDTKKILKQVKIKEKQKIQGRVEPLFPEATLERFGAKPVEKVASKNEQEYEER